MQANWSKPFVEYFNNEVHPDVSNSIGWWVLEKLHVYNPYSGVTNQSEGYNTVMKRLQQWKEVPIDLIILSLNELQVYSYNEIQRGLCQMGEYVLCWLYHHRAQYTNVFTDTPEALPIQGRYGNYTRAKLVTGFPMILNLEHL